jgi:hypothetical protein
MSKKKNKKKQKKKQKRQQRSFRLYTRKQRKLTDIWYLVNYIIARTAESRLALASLPGASGDQREQVMRSVLDRLAAGNSEAERLYRLLNEAEPYMQDVGEDDEWIMERIPESPEIEAVRKLLEAAIPEFANLQA